MPKISPVDYKCLVRILEKEGFVLSRTKGDHLVFTKTGIIRPVVVPKYDEVPVFIIKNILRTANIQREKYFELLKDN